MGQPLKHVFQVSERIDLQAAARGGQCVEDRRSSATGGTAKKEPGLFSHYRVLHRLLRSVIVERDGTGFQKTREAFPASGHVIDRTTQVVFWTKRLELVIQPTLEFLQNGYPLPSSRYYMLWFGLINVL